MEREALRLTGTGARQRDLTRVEGRSGLAAGEKIPAGDEKKIPAGVGILFSQ